MRANERRRGDEEDGDLRCIRDDDGLCRVDGQGRVNVLGRLIRQ